MTTFPIGKVRAAFPAVQDSGGFVFFDNAAGAQVPGVVLDAIRDHLLARNVQRGGRYRKSQEVDAMIVRARESVADFVNARDPDEVAFGMNATSFIRIVSLAIGQTLAEARGDRQEIVVTDLDHEANVATWLALEKYGARILWWKMRNDGRLHVEDLEPLLSARTRLVACALASNAIGSIVDAPQVVARAHAAGAEVFFDAVHSAPHLPIDVQAFGCDYLVCSGYKIFGPHMGFLWGRKAALDALPTFREDFLPDTAPTKFEVGTYVYENVAGMAAAIGYLEGLGRSLAPDSNGATRRTALVRAMEAIREYEAGLSLALLQVLSDRERFTVYGIADPALVRHRTPTLCFNVKGVPAACVSERLAEQGIGVRDGHMYAPRLMRSLGIPVESGAVRATLVHYNTMEEIERFAAAVSSL